MTTQLVTVNSYLTFLVEFKKSGTAITAFYDEEVIGKKKACNHARCNITFVAEMTAAAEQMRAFEKVFDVDDLVNKN